MSVGHAQRIELVFYQTEAGNVPVRDWLLDLPESYRREIGQDLLRVQCRWFGPWEKVYGKPGPRCQMASSPASCVVFTTVNFTRCMASSKSRKRHPLLIWHWPASAGKRLKMAENKHRGPTLDSFLGTEHVLAAF
jgi:hypothetical protein